MSKCKEVDVKGRLRKFGQFVFNRQKRTVLGRTALSWLLIILFYIVFYAVLAAFFIAMLCVLLFGVVDDSQPKLTGTQSLLRMLPSVDYKPRPVYSDTLISYKMDDATTYAPFVKNLQELYSSHSTVNSSLDGPTMSYADCDLSNPQANRGFDPAKRICRQNPATTWGNCTPAGQFGYPDGQPCVVVKLNRMFGWIPRISQPDQLNHTMLVCEPENDGDGPNLGRVDYYPGVSINGTSYGYFSSALFPFLNQPGYTSASVAVRFTGVRHNVLLMVQCRLDNLKDALLDKPNRIGLTHFELLIRTAKPVG